MICYNTYATHLNIARSRGILLVKMYSLSLTLCRCVATLREAFFSAFLRVRTFFIGGDFMSIYKKMYYHLFNCVTDALEEADIDKVKEILKNAQIETEEIYISSDE